MGNEFHYFTIGDQVRLVGFGNQIFTIATVDYDFCTLGYDDVAYHVQNILTHEILVVFIEDLILYKRKVEIKQEQESTNREASRQSYEIKRKVDNMNKSRRLFYGNFTTIDEALDMINDLDTLHKMFNDIHFEKCKKKITTRLTNIINNKENLK